MVDRLVAVNDADYKLPDPVLAALSVDLGGSTTVLGSVIETRTFVIDTNYANLEDALTAVAVGGVLEVRGTWSRSTTFTVNKACTVRFAEGGSITGTSSSIAVITVTSSDVTIENPLIVGNGSGTLGTGKGILAVGTVGSPIRRLRIVKPRISATSEYGIYLEFCDTFSIEQPAITSIAYAGIAMSSCSSGSVSGGSVTNLTQPAGFVNSYGITVSRRTNSAGELTTYPRSRDIRVTGVTIDGVPLWEGLDTHGGENLEFSGNTIRNCLVGIAVVPSSNNAGTATYAPLGVKVTKNTVVGAGDGTNSAGIWFIGTASEYATGSIVDNRVVDTGGDTASAGNNWGGIAIDRTFGLNVAVNALVRCAVAGVHVISGNVGTVIADNVVEDVWSTLSGICSAVYVRSSPNTILVSGTQMNRGAKTATRVNAEGIRCNTSSTQTDGGGNQWQLATVSSVVNGTAFKSSVYGATPVVRAAAITTPTAPGVAYDQTQMATLKTAIDDLRNAVKNYGITF